MNTQTKTAHTPGPWQFIPEKLYQGQHVGGRGISVAAASRTIAKIDGRDPESEANACLIAAAPELLEALKTIADAWDSPLERRALLYQHLEAAKSAIQKAEG